MAEVFVALRIASSFNGKTTDFDSVNGSSILSEAAIYKIRKGVSCGLWNEIKAEYIAGGTSYRKLAKKYNVSFQTLQQVARREEWVELRRQAQDKTATKIVNSIVKSNTKNAVKLDTVTDKVLDRILKFLEDNEELGSQSLKNLTSALKDIKSIKDIKSDIDIEEQQARINKLRKDTESNDADDKPCGVVLMPDVMESPTPPSEVEDDE